MAGPGGASPAPERNEKFYRSFEGPSPIGLGVTIDLSGVPHVGL